MKKKSVLREFIVWVKRFRQRKGYGVHSPFAFNFITQVLYEKGFYYKYEDISALAKKNNEPVKYYKLLFRLVNYNQPNKLYCTASYKKLEPIFRWAKADIDVSYNINTSYGVDFLYIAPDQFGNIQENIETIYEQITSKSILVIYGIGCSKKALNYWRQLIMHKGAGISFDLYDFGILFFDKKLNKQDYIVNFEF